MRAKWMWELNIVKRFKTWSASCCVWSDKHVSTFFFVIGTQQNQSLENTGAKSMNLYSETEVIMTDDTQKKEQLSIDIWVSQEHDARLVLNPLVLIMLSPMLCFGTFFSFLWLFGVYYKQQCTCTELSFWRVHWQHEPTGLFSRAANCGESVTIVIKTHLF